MSDRETVLVPTAERSVLHYHRERVAGIPKCGPIGDNYERRSLDEAAEFAEPCGSCFRDELRTDGGEEFAHDNWLEALKATGEQFDAENDDLEAILEGDIGFHTFFAADADDPTRGVETAIHQAVNDTFEELFIDAEGVEISHGEVTPESVAEEVLAQIEGNIGQYLSDPLRANIRERVEKRVEANQSSSEEIATDGGMVSICPECGNTQIYRLNPDHPSSPGTSTDKWYCATCQETFDEPTEREPRAEPDLRGLAGALDEADPEEVGKDSKLAGGQR